MTISARTSTQVVDECDGYLARMAAGDESAVADLYDATHLLVYRIAFAATRDAQTAADVLVDVYREVWRMARLYSPGGGKVDRWLCVVAQDRGRRSIDSTSLGT
jgi:DNA-directed RNA polymerase specialized sigma24 family protein